MTKSLKTSTIRKKDLTMKKLAVAVCAAVAALNGAFAGKVYYFDPENGKDTNDGLTEETAFQHLSMKSGSTSATGDEYRLMKGVYRETFVIRAPNLTIRGWKASRDEVIIDGENERRGIKTHDYSEFSYTNGVICGLTVRNCVIANYLTNSGNNGAGIALLSRDLMVSNCVVYACHNNGNNGGGIALMYAGGKVVDCVVSNCTAAGGGGICVVTSSNEPGFEVRGCTVRNCQGISRTVNDGKTTQKGMGGALYAQRGISISNCTFAENSADDSGGGIFLADKSSSTILRDDFITDVQIISNVSKQAGGIYAGQGGTNYLAQVTLVGNVATNGNGGGVLAASQSRLDIEEGCAFVDNATETGFGGGIYVTADMGCVISNALFRGNRSVKGGGGAYMQTARSAFLNCVFDANSCSGETKRCCGGAVHAGGAHGDVATFRNCLFTRNSACAGSGGAIGNEMTRSITNYLENCTFVSNFVYGTSTDSSDGYGGAVGGVSVSFCATNTVFFRNTSLSRTMYVQIQNKKLVAYANCFEDLLDGTNANFLKNGVNGCIVAEGDPGFTDAANGDYTLTKDSILVDKGINLDWMDAATDLRQKKRCRRIYNDIVDLGCYEYWPVPGLLLMVR